MSRIGLPVPPGFTISTEVCTVYYELRPQASPTSSKPMVSAALDEVGQDRRRAVRRRGQSAARLRRVGLPRLDARHDGHGAQSRPQRPDRRGAGAALAATAASPTTPIAASSRCMPTWCSGVDHELFEEILENYKNLNGFELDTELTAEDWAELVARYKAVVETRARRALSAGPARPAMGRDRRRVRLLAERARHHLSAAARHSRRLGHRRQRPGHGVRQYGRHERDRRRLHAQSLDRRQRALRRVPGQRPGRGRGRRHPHAADP